MIFSALVLLAGIAPLITAQSTSGSYVVATVTLPGIVPNGVENTYGNFESTFPTECDAGCAVVSSSYFYCYINRTQHNGQQENTTLCNEYFCQQTTYDLLSACLNCIVANGNERPLGYSSNTSMTAAPTEAPFGGKGPFNPNGLVNSTQADGWLKNVSDSCASVSSSVTGLTTVTATPTTTGPYTASWTSGATVSISVWTGLTSFTSAISQAYASIVFNETIPASDAGVTTATQTGTGGSSGSTSAAAASGSTSAKSPAFRQINVPAWARVLSKLF